MSVSYIACISADQVTVSKGRGLVPPLRSSRFASGPGPGRHLGHRRSTDEAELHDTLRHQVDPLAHLAASTLYAPDNMHVLIFDWLNSTFPHPKNRFVNGAQGGVGSGYFGWCFSASRRLLVSGGTPRLMERQRSIYRTTRISCWSSWGSTTCPRLTSLEHTSISSAGC